MTVATRPRAFTPQAALLFAQEAALASDQRLDRLTLDPISRRVPDVAVHDSIVDARAILTIEGASTVELAVHDPEWGIEASGLLDPDDDGRMNALDIALDGIAYRLASARREGTNADTLRLTFEDRVVALLRSRWGALSASRGTMTRAQFIGRLVREVKSYPIPYYSPDLAKRQPVARPEFPSAAPTSDESGFDKGAKLTVKGSRADAEQRRNIEIALSVADQEDAGPKATLALIVAGIGESSFRRQATQPDTKAHGVYQLIPATARALSLDPEDTEATARHFLRRGYYNYGGAIKLARENPTITVGEIVSKVEGSDQGGSFYQAYADEARDIVAAWNGGSSTSDDDEVLRVKAYQFTRGLPPADDPKEDSFEAALRLAEEVNWRFFATGGIAAFLSDDAMMLNKAALVLDSPDAPGLIERPTYDWHHGKLAGELELHVNANRYAIAPGAAIALPGRAWGPAGGRWITHTADYSLLVAEDAVLSLIKPRPPRKEPAPDVTTTSKKKKRDGKDPKTTSSGLTYPLAEHGTKGGGPEEHAKRAWGNWQSDNAVDILVAQGTAVYAVDAGEIVKLGGAWRGGSGNPDGFNVTLKTDDNEWFYTHLRFRSPKLQVGLRVRAGDFLGSSGAANGVNHLHIASETGNPVELLGLSSSS